MPRKTPKDTMLKAIKRTLTAGAVIAAVSAPSSAFARLDLNPEPPVAPHPAQLATPAPQARPVAEASSSRGFEWGDAGLGAAGTLVLLGTGAGSAAVIGRRRGHRTALS